MNDRPLIPTRPRPDGAIGPGSQPPADDVELGYLPMPGEMRTYRPPIMPEPEDVAGLIAGQRLLKTLLVLLTGYRVGALPQVLDLGALATPDRRLVEDSLGVGEVSIQRDGDEPVQAQETRLAGVWRVRQHDTGGRLRRDVLEVSDIPGFVRFGSFDGASDRIRLPGELPAGVMNAPGVLAELDAELGRRRRQDDDTARAPHIVNLTLLPLSERDPVFLAEQLGTGLVTILSRGYGNCRITATAIRDIWWVQHFNSDDRLILNTLEVTDIPEAALAAQEDIEDSAERLREILDALA